MKTAEQDKKKLKAEATDIVAQHVERMVNITKLEMQQQPYPKAEVKDGKLKIVRAIEKDDPRIKDRQPKILHKNTVTPVSSLTDLYYAKKAMSRTKEKAPDVFNLKSSKYSDSQKVFIARFGGFVNEAISEQCLGPSGFFPVIVSIGATAYAGCCQAQSTNNTYFC